MGLYCVLVEDFDCVFFGLKIFLGRENGLRFFLLFLFCFLFVNDVHRHKSVFSTGRLRFDHDYFLEFVECNNSRGCWLRGVKFEFLVLYFFRRFQVFQRE